MRDMQRLLKRTPLEEYTDIEMKKENAQFQAPFKEHKIHQVVV